MCLHWSKNLVSVPSCTTNEAHGEEVVDCSTSEHHTSWVPFFVDLEELVDAPQVDVLPLWYLCPRVRVRSFAKEFPLDCGTGHCCILSWKPVLGLALPPLTEVDNWDRLSANYCLIWARDQRNSFCKVVKKGKVWSPDFMIMPGRSIKKKC